MGKQKIIGLILPLVVYLFCCGCTRFVVVQSIEGYQEFLHTYEKYTDTLPTPSDTLPAIEGFRPLASMYFSYGLPFDGDVTYAERDGRNFLLHTNGKTEEVQNSLPHVPIISGVYVYGAQNAYGVRSVYGEEILPPRYDSIQIKGETILAMRDIVAEIYVNRTLFSTITVDSSKPTELLTDRYLVANEKICDLAFRACYFKDMPYLDVPHENKVAVALPDGFMGYADISKDVLFTGRYVYGSAFHVGVATAVTPEHCGVIIDSDGRELYRAEDCRIGTKNDAYFCYWQYGAYGVMDGDFRIIIEPMFPYIKGERVYGRYLIAARGDGECLYDVVRNAFREDLTFESVTSVDGLFFGKASDGKTWVLNGNLQVLTVCDEAVWSDGVLMTVADNRYTYYVRSEL